MREISPTAKRRINDLERETSDKFDNRVVAHFTSVRVKESDRLRHLVDAVDSVRSLDEREGYNLTPFRDEVEKTARLGADSLDSHVDSVVADVITEACVEVINDADTHYEHCVEKTVHEALDEAHEWLTNNEDVVDRLDIEIPDPEWSPPAEPL